LWKSFSEILGAPNRGEEEITHVPWRKLKGRTNSPHYITKL